MLRELNGKEKGRLFRRYLATDVGRDRHAAHLACVSQARYDVNSACADLTVVLEDAAKLGGKLTVAGLRQLSLRADGSDGGDREDSPKRLRDDAHVPRLVRAVNALGAAHMRLHVLVDEAVEANPPPGVVHGRVITEARARFAKDASVFREATDVLSSLVDLCAKREAYHTKRDHSGDVDLAFSWADLRRTYARARDSVADVSKLSITDARASYTRYYAR